MRVGKNEYGTNNTKAEDLQWLQNWMGQYSSNNTFLNKQVTALSYYLEACEKTEKLKLHIKAMQFFLTIECAIDTMLEGKLDNSISDLISNNKALLLVLNKKLVARLYPKLDQLIEKRKKLVLPTDHKKITMLDKLVETAGNDQHKQKLQNICSRETKCTVGHFRFSDKMPIIFKARQRLGAQSYAVDQDNVVVNLKKLEVCEMSNSK